MRLVASMIAVTTAISLYIASPLLAAWTLREDIRRGDTAAVERRVDWPRVRASLKTALKSETQTAAMLEAEAKGRSKPSLWQRVKLGIGAGMIDRYVDTTFTPTGVVTAYAAKMKADALMGRSDEATKPFGTRVLAFLRRIERIEHPTLGRFVISVRDRTVAGRLYVGDLQLQNFEWRLVDLAILQTAPAGQDPATLAASVPR
jgi:hypothetical protein